VTAVATFDVCPPFPVVQISERTALQTPDGSLVVQSRQINERALRQWELTWPRDASNALARIKYLFALCFGTVLTMDWENPDGDDIEVRFARAIEYSRDGASASTISVVLEEEL
jgi:hypothetical protein